MVGVINLAFSIWIRCPAEDILDLTPCLLAIRLHRQPHSFGVGSGHPLQTTTGQIGKAIDRVQANAGIFQDGRAGQMQRQRTGGCARKRVRTRECIQQTIAAIQQECEEIVVT